MAAGPLSETCNIIVVDNIQRVFDERDANIARFARLKIVSLERAQNSDLTYYYLLHKRQAKYYYFDIRREMAYGCPEGRGGKAILKCIALPG